MSAEPEIRVDAEGVELRAGDSWCRSRIRTLKSGLFLDLTRCRFDPALRFQAEARPAEIELVVSSGAVIETRTADGGVQLRGGNTLQIGSLRRSEAVAVQAQSDAEMRCAGIGIGAARLKELLGASALPEPIRRVVTADERHPRHTEVTTPALVDLLDELTGEEGRGVGYGLWLEAKALELIALATDAVAASFEAETRPLSTSEVDRLERARTALVARLDQPPTLRALAKHAGMSETRLKAAFRQRFGAPVFDYLRTARLEEARRHLLTPGRSVTEVALTVGYSNPSKFAAAFRRTYGVSPSEIAARSPPPRRRG